MADGVSGVKAAIMESPHLEAGEVTAFCRRSGRELSTAQDRFDREMMLYEPFFSQQFQVLADSLSTDASAIWIDITRSKELALTRSLRGTWESSIATVAGSTPPSDRNWDRKGSIWLPSRSLGRLTTSPFSIQCGRPESQSGQRKVEAEQMSGSGERDRTFERPTLGFPLLALSSSPLSYEQSSGFVQQSFGGACRKIVTRS